MDSIFKQPPSASFQAGFKYTYMVKPVSTRWLTVAGQADGHSRAQSLFVRQCHVGCQCAAHSELHRPDSKLASPQTPVATASACRAAFCDARARSASTHTTTHHVQRTYRCGTTYCIPEVYSSQLLRQGSTKSMDTSQRRRQRSVCAKVPRASWEPEHSVPTQCRTA